MTRRIEGMAARSLLCEPHKEAIYKMYSEGLGAKRICVALGWTKARATVLRASLTRWGVYRGMKDWQPWNLGNRARPKYDASEIIMVEYRKEAKAAVRPDEAWSAPWKSETARRNAKEDYYANRDAKLAYAKVRDAKRQADPEHRKKRNEQARSWRARNSQHKAAYDRKWMRDNRDKVRAYAKRPETKLANNLRKRVKCIIARSSERVSELCGCSGTKLRLHIERQWKRGMTWANYGAWHIDHRIPCASFDLTDQSQRRQCFHFTNLQPMWAADNMKKGARIAQPEQVALAIAA